MEVSEKSDAMLKSEDNENIEQLAADNHSEDNNVLSANGGGNNDSDVKGAVIKTSSPTVFIKGSTFNIRLLDDNGKPIANKAVKIKFNNIKTTLKTSKKGYVFYELNTTGTFKLSYSFTAKGYAPITGSKKITIVPNNETRLEASDYVAYVGAKNPFTVTLTTGGIPLPNKTVVFSIKGVKYSRTTNSKGVATLNINLVKEGKHTFKYSFKGIKNAATSATGKAKITVIKGFPTNIVKQKSYVYKPKVSTPFIIKYKDARGNPIPNHTIVFKINKKTYKVKTDKNGYAKIKLKLNKGYYTLKVSAAATKVYKKATNSYSIRVISDVKYDNYGFWLFGADMKKVNLKAVAGKGINRIFLNFYAVTLHGKSAISAFCEEAKTYGIKVDIWMQVFYKSGTWYSPVYSDGSYKYDLFNSIIKEAKSYAKIAGVDGIHFDYLRFPGTAYKHTNGVKAINYFTKKACTELHALNPKLTISAAVMPEPSSMLWAYGQDIPTLSKYLDVIVPMVYKGNYNQGTSWIKSVTSSFESQSKGAQIWTGLQSYYSDSYVSRLPASELRNDAVSSISGGATGVILFRYTLCNLFDYSTI